MIGLDLMGGDTPALELLKAVAHEIAEQKLKVSLAVFGTKSLIKKFANLSLPHTELIPVNSVIEIDEDPLSAIRKKKGASTHIAMKMLKSGEIDALLSIGNTGALLAGAKLHLNPFKSISRPALITTLPTQKKSMAVLDVGANTTCKPDHLLQFAKMGVAYQKALGIRRPKIGLLNTGAEKSKGRKEYRDAYKLLARALKTSFKGNIEGFDAFSGDVDVLVTDGFTGNIFLKTCEGLAKFFLSETKIKKKSLDNESYPGALLCGVEHIIMKCHSSSSAKAIARGLKTTLELLKNDFITLMQRQIG